MPKKDMFGLGKMGNFNMPDLKFDSGSNSGFNMDLDLGLNLGGLGQGKSKPFLTKARKKQFREAGERIREGGHVVKEKVKEAVVRWRAKDVGRKGHHYIRLRNGKKYGRLRSYKRRY